MRLSFRVKRRAISQVRDVEHDPIRIVAESLERQLGIDCHKDGPMVRRQGLFDDLMSIGLKLPWKVGVAAAVVIFVTLHFVAIYTQAPVNANSLADIGAVIQHGFIHTFAELLQYIIPARLLIGTAVGYFKQRRSGALFASTRANPKPTVTSMSWRDFE